MQSIGAVIHKEKKQKKTEAKSPTVSSTTDNSTIVQGITHVNSQSEQIEAHQNRYKSIGQQGLIDKERNARRILNAEIDDRVSDWVMEGLVSEQFMNWVAGCCHTLGLAKVNLFSIKARAGKQPDRLFSSMLKGAMQLHAKRQFTQGEL